MSSITQSQAREIASQFAAGREENFSISAPPSGTKTLQEIASVAPGERKYENCMGLLPGNASRYNELASRMATESFDLSDRSEREAYSNLLKASCDPRDNVRQKASAELANYRIFRLECDSTATPFASSAYLSVSLNDDEMPLFEIPVSNHLNHFNVSCIGPDGSPKRCQWRTGGDCKLADLDILSSCRVEYSEKDLRTGDINEEANIEARLREDMDFKIEDLAEKNLEGCIMKEGLRDICNLHPKIDASNIPDANYYDLNFLFPGNKCKMTVEKLRFILAHFVMFQSIPTRDGACTINSIYMSPHNTTDPWCFTDHKCCNDGSPSNSNETVPEGVRDQIFASGSFTSMYGFSFPWIPNACIPKGRLYIFTNKPVGWHFTKSCFDRILRQDGTTNFEYALNNMGELVYQRSCSFYSPDLWKHRMLIIDL